MEPSSKKGSQFVRENWFKLGILLVGIIIAWIVYNALVVQPRNQARFEEGKVAAEKEAEQKRADSLQTCLAESEYLRSASHLALCGDPNVGRTGKSCYNVFSGATSYLDALGSYKAEFNELDSDNYADNSLRIAQAFSDFRDKCNCGLEKYRRDALDTEKDKRDDICFKTYGK